MPASSAGIDRDDIERFLSALVRVPSVNPPGDEMPVARLIQARLAALGLAIRIVESAPGRPNLIARLEGSDGGPTLLLNGHMDVQPPGTQWTREPFAAEVEGTRLYGQGAMDMKAGLAAIVFAVESIVQSGVSLTGDT